MKPFHGAEADTVLLAWWLDELPEAEANELEEHLFACDECAARLKDLLGLRESVQRALLDARFVTAVSPGFLQQIKESGLRIREYRVAAGGSVTCTIAPEDDLVVSRLEAPLAGVRQLDLIFDDGGTQHRAAHIPFDAASGEVTVIPPVAVIRGWKSATQRMRLVAVNLGAERVIGEYTFNHSPWAANI
jgi:hypothetical protein